MSPRSPEAFAQIRAESREALLRAALELFARHGFAGTTVRMIAERAGVSLGLLYNYFSGKEELLMVLFQQGMADVLDSFAEADFAATPGQRLIQLVRGSFEIIARNRDFWAVFYGLRAQPGILEVLPNEVRTWPQRIHRQLSRYLSDLGHPDPDSGGWLLFATIDGLAQQWTLVPEMIPIDAVLDALIRSYYAPDAEGERP